MAGFLPSCRCSFSTYLFRLSSGRFHKCCAGPEVQKSVFRFRRWSWTANHWPCTPNRLQPTNWAGFSQLMVHSLLRICEGLASLSFEYLNPDNYLLSGLKFPLNFLWCGTSTWIWAISIFKSESWNRPWSLWICYFGRLIIDCCGPWSCSWKSVWVGYSLKLAGPRHCLAIADPETIHLSACWSW